MNSPESAKFEAHLLQGENKFSIEAKYASRFSLMIRFLNGYNPTQESEFEKLVININEAKVEIGPCRYIYKTKNNGYHGHLVFCENVYDLKELFFKEKLESLQSEFSNLSLILTHKNEIKSNFKDYTANLTYDLNSYKHKFDKLDLKFDSEPKKIKHNVQKAIIETEGRKFMNFLDKKLDEFEYIVSDYSKKDHTRHGYYFRTQLWNLILCSPFMARTNIRPRGYSGDSVMMNMLYTNQYEGSTTFGKLMHKHPVEHPAAQAVRNRRNIITQFLKTIKSEKLKENSKKIKVLSVACGPALELEDVLKSQKDCSDFEFALLDQDKNALEEAESLVTKIENRFEAKIEVNYLNDSVRSMVSASSLDGLWGKFDFIYSMGLFDYLTPPAAKVVLRQLLKILNKNGELVIGNFHISNPSRYYMEYWLDWNLYYRTEQEFLDLIKNEAIVEKKVLFEDTGSQMFLHVKKPVK